MTDAQVVSIVLLEVLGAALVGGWLSRRTHLKGDTQAPQSSRTDQWFARSMNGLWCAMLVVLGADVFGAPWARYSAVWLVLGAWLVGTLVLLAAAVRARPKRPKPTHTHEPHHNEHRPSSRRRRKHQQFHQHAPRRTTSD